MEIYRNIEAMPSAGGRAVTLGMFDGVHLGHRAMVLQLLELARERGLRSTVVTFWPHPRVFFGGEVGMLTTLDEKIMRLGELGVDELLIIEFDGEFASLGAREFIEKYLQRGLDARLMVLGYNNRFGSDGLGPDECEALIERSGIEIVRGKEIAPRGIHCSSSRIRKALETGDVITARVLLGYDYSFEGVVEHGQQLGRRLGFPTANVGGVDGLKQQLPAGVYICSFKLLDDCNLFSGYGVLSVGFKPTVNGEADGSRKKLSIEVHVFDYSGDLYGKRVRVGVMNWIRGEKRFAGLDELRSQIARDADFAKDFLQREGITGLDS